MEAAPQQLVHGRDVVRLEQLQDERMKINTVQYSTVHTVHHLQDEGSVHDDESGGGGEQQEGQIEHKGGQLVLAVPVQCSTVQYSTAGSTSAQTMS